MDAGATGGDGATGAIGAVGAFEGATLDGEGDVSAPFAASTPAAPSGAGAGFGAGVVFREASRRLNNRSMRLAVLALGFQPRRRTVTSTGWRPKVSASWQLHM